MPSGPGNPGAPGTVPTPGQPARPTGSSTGAPEAEQTSWEFWWAFNKAPYLNLKSFLYGGPESDPETAYLGTQAAQEHKQRLRPTREQVQGRIVPALRAALQRERSNDIVTGALVALAKIGDERDDEGRSAIEQTLVKFLPDAQQEVAETAAVSLGILASDASVRTLEHLLRADDSGRNLVGGGDVPIRTRAFAAYGLGLIGARTNQDSLRQDIAGILIDVLQGVQGPTRDVHVACLIALGLTPVLPGAAEGARTGPAATRQGEIEFVLGLLRDARRSPLVRAHAPRALAHLVHAGGAALDPSVGAGVTRALLAALERESHEPVELRQAAVLALGQLGDADADELDATVRARLMQLAEADTDVQSKCFALIALAQAGGRAGGGEDSRAGCQQVRNFLGARLVKGATWARPWAGLAIGVQERACADDAQQRLQPSSGQKELLREALGQARTPDEVGALSIACGLTRDLEARARLLDKLESAPGETTRGYVAVALGMLGDRRSIEPIRQIVRNSKYDAQLLQQAAIGLGLLGDKELVPELCTMLAEARGLSSQAAIASGLGFIGDARSVDPLIAMLQGEPQRLTAAARGFAAVALGLVADKEPLPWNAKISVDIDYRANTTSLTGAESTGVLDIL
jgi:HEAT repeat protein